MARTRIKIGVFELFSPTAFIILFIASFLLFTLRLSYSIAPVSLDTVVYVILCIIMFALGLVAANLRTKKGFVDVDVRTPYKWIWPFFFVGISIYALEYVVFVARFGNLPILLPDFENRRFDFPLNGYLHLMAMASRAPLLFIYAYFAKFGMRNLHKWGLFFAIFIVLIFDFMQGVRGAALLFVVSLMVTYSAYRNIGSRFFLIAFLALVFLGVAKTWREYEMYGSSSLTSVEADSKLPGGVVGVSLYHLYMAFAYNFAMLNEYISRLHEHFYGYFSIAYGVISLAPGEQYGLVNLQYDVLRRDFHAALTATMLSYPYFDFGFLGCLVIGALAWMVQTIYLNAYQTREIRYVAGYAYVCTNLFLGIYTYTFSEIHVQMNIALLLFVFPIFSKLFVGRRYV